MAIIEIKCPSCSEVIKVDAVSGMVIEHKSSEKNKAGLDEFLKSQKSRASDLEEMFNKSKEEQKKRQQELDEQFKKAKENPDALEGDYQSPFQWD